MEDEKQLRQLAAVPYDDLRPKFRANVGSLSLQVSTHSYALELYV